MGQKGPNGDKGWSSSEWAPPLQAGGLLFMSSSALLHNLQCFGFVFFVCFTVDCIPWGRCHVCPVPYGSLRAWHRAWHTQKALDRSPQGPRALPPDSKTNVFVVHSLFLWYNPQWVTRGAYCRNDKRQCGAVV